MARRFVGFSALLFLTWFAVSVSVRVATAQDARPPSGNGDEVALFQHEAPVLCLAVSPDRQLAITGGGSVVGTDYALRLWDIKTRKELRRFEGHQSLVRGVDISPDGETVASVGEDGTIRLWRLKTGNELRLLTGHGKRTHTVCFTPDGGRVVTGSIDGTVRVWDINTGREVSRLKPKIPSDSFRPRRTHVLSDGLRAVTGCDEGWIYMWELKTGRELWKNAKFRGLFDLAISPDGRHVLASGDKILLLDVETGKQVSGSSTGRAVTALTYLSKGDDYVGIRRDHSGPFLTWRDAKTFSERKKFRGHFGAILQISDALDNDHVLTIGTDHTARLWRMAAETDSDKPQATRARRVKSKLEMILDSSVNATQRRAEAFQRDNRPLEAVAAYDLRTKIARDAYRDDPVEEFGLLIYTGDHMMHAAGEYARAQLMYMRALELAPAAGNYGAQRTGELHFRLSQVYMTLGQHQKRLSHLLDAVRCLESTYAPDNFELLQACEFLSHSYRSFGKREESDRMMAFVTGGGDRAGESKMTDRLLVSRYIYAGQREKAVPILVAQLRKDLARFGPTSESTLQSQFALAELYMGMREYRLAQPILEYRYKTLLGKWAPEDARMIKEHEHMVWLHMGLGNLRKAAEFADKERRMNRQYIYRSLPLLSQSEQISFLTTQSVSGYYNAISLAHQGRNDKSIVEASAEWVLNNKGVGLQALAERSLLARSSTNPDVARLAKRLRETRNQLAAHSITNPVAGKEVEHRREQRKLTAQADQLARELGSLSGSGSREVPWITLDQVRSAIPSDAVLIEITKSPIRNFAMGKTGGFWKRARYMAWVIPSQGKGAVRLIDLGDARAVDRAVKLLREYIDASGGFANGANESNAVLRLLEKLNPISKAILSPMLPHVGEAKRWIISPEFALWLAPWEALPLANGKFAVEEYEISYVLTGRDLLAGGEKAKSSAPIIFANPDYNLAMDKAGAETQRILAGKKTDAPPVSAVAAVAVSRPLAGSVFGPLPGTAKEAQNITPSLASYAKMKPIVYTDKQALEGVFKASKGPKVLVLSTHGFFLSRGVVKNPLLRCGLALAGANNRGRSANTKIDDGILTGVEILETNLRGTELVVLSACDTGIGQLQRGEGVGGLRSAFQLAGARAVVATLWSIPDQETADLQNFFFKNLASGQRKAEALRNAKISIIQQRRQKNGAAHPYYWAAFTLTQQGS